MGDNHRMEPSPTPPPVRHRSRPSRRILAVLAVVLVAWLCGKGLGIVGKEAEPDVGSPATSPSAAHTAKAPQVPAPGPATGAGAELTAKLTSGPAANGGSQPGPAAGTNAATHVAAAPDAAAAGTASAIPAGPLGEGAATASPTPVAPSVPAANASGPGLDHDRFTSTLSLLASQTEAGELGGALETLSHLRRMPLDGAQRTALLLPGEALERALAEACSRVVQHLGNGRVLAARAECGQLFGDGQDLALPWLATAMRAAGQPDLTLQPAARSAATPLPQPRALPRGRAVRIAYGERTGTGVVVDARAHEATVKLPNANGFAFPTVPVVAVEPVEATGDEAVEMAFAALQINDVLLARIWQWVAVAQRPTATALGERASLLANWLR